MIRWPNRALGAIRKLFEPLQDIDVYVEDQDDEVFYTHLLKRIAGDRVRVARVFALGGSLAVTDAANAHENDTSENKRPSLFLIDGDLMWVRGDPCPSVAHCLFRLDAYCIENLLVCETAATKVLMEEAVLSFDDAKAALNFTTWISSIQAPLVRMFCAYAVINKYAPEVKTVKNGIGKLCTASGKGTIACLDLAKVQAAEIDALQDAETRVGKLAVSSMFASILDRANGFAIPHDVVSGKDYLLPLLDFKLQTHGARIKRNTLRLRLALACELRRFDALLVALEETARGTRSN